MNTLTRPTKHSMFAYALFMLFTLCTPWVAAQESTADRNLVYGTVMSDTQEPLEVYITEVNPSGRILTATTTDRKGVFSLRITNPGHEIRFQRAGYVEVKQAIGSTRYLDIVMHQDVALVQPPESLSLSHALSSRAISSSMSHGTSSIHMRLPSIGVEVWKNARERATSFGIGRTSLYDSYLSPQAYSGWEYRIMRESMTATPWYRSGWAQQTHFQGFFSNTEHPSKDNHNYTLMSEWRWGYLYDFYLPALHGLHLMAGAQVYAEGGAIYNLGNGNNPVSAKVGGGIGSTLLAKYMYYCPLLWPLKRGYITRPASVRLQLFAPIVGLFFSPHYGQSYYEIFELKNDDDIVKVSTPFNKPSLWIHASADAPLTRSTSLRISVVGDIRQSRVEELRYHNRSLSAMLGFVYHFVRL